MLGAMMGLLPGSTCVELVNISERATAGFLEALLPWRTSEGTLEGGAQGSWWHTRDGRARLDHDQTAAPRCDICLAVVEVAAPYCRFCTLTACHPCAARVFRERQPCPGCRRDPSAAARIWGYCVALLDKETGEVQHHDVPSLLLDMPACIDEAALLRHAAVDPSEHVFDPVASWVDVCRPGTDSAAAARELRGRAFSYYKPSTTVENNLHRKSHPMH